MEDIDALRAELDDLREILYHAADLAANPTNAAARRAVYSAFRYYRGADETLQGAARRAAASETDTAPGTPAAALLAEALTLERQSYLLLATARTLRDIARAIERAELAAIME